MKLRAILFAGIVGLGFTAIAAAETPVEIREGLMKGIGKSIGAMAAIAKGEKPYDAEVVKTSLTTIAANIKDFPNHFPEGSQAGSEASPKIWENMEDFKAKAAKLGTDAETILAQLPADQAGVGAALGMLGKDCSDCHQTYRLKK